MSDKPTKNKTSKPCVTEVICQVKDHEDYGSFDGQGWTVDRTIGILSELYPDWFAPKPEPDPVEEWIECRCAVCAYQEGCDKGRRSACREKRDALRAYVADLEKENAELKQKGGNQ